MATWRARVSKVQYGYVEVEADSHEAAADEIAGYFAEDIQWDEFDDYDGVEIEYMDEL
jgi:hypothetical protein